MKRGRSNKSKNNLEIENKGKTNKNNNLKKNRKETRMSDHCGVMGGEPIS